MHGKKKQYLRCLQQFRKNTGEQQWLVWLLLLQKTAIFSEIEQSDTGREGEIILKKYSPIEELAECAAGFTKSISTVTGCLVCVSDQEQIVAANGPEQKNYLGKSISSRLEEAILNRKTVLARPGEKAYFSILENTDNTTPLPELIFPILSSGDAIGSVILCGKDRESLLGDTEKKLLQVAATYLGREMEN